MDFPCLVTFGTKTYTRKIANIYRMKQEVEPHVQQNYRFSSVPISLFLDLLSRQLIGDF